MENLLAHLSPAPMVDSAVKKGIDWIAAAQGS
jgi:hypothetical protein